MIAGLAALCLAVARALRVDDTPVWLGGAAVLFFYGLILIVVRTHRKAEPNIARQD
jgi:hypothetical protein